MLLVCIIIVLLTCFRFHSGPGSRLPFQAVGVDLTCGALLFTPPQPSWAPVNVCGLWWKGSLVFLLNLHLMFPQPQLPLLLLPTVLIGLISMMSMSLSISTHSPLPSTKLSTKAFSPLPLTLSPSPLFKSSTCWGLAECGSFRSTWPSHP